jgi:hypothetical protein
MDEDLQPVGRQLDGNGFAGHNPGSTSLIDRSAVTLVGAGVRTVENGCRRIP